MFFFTCDQLKKIKKPTQRHISESAELDGGGGFSRKKDFYEDGIQTENFIRTKTRNDIYYRGENHYQP